MSTLYIIQGFIGAGKTTWSKKLALQTGAPRLNADDWCAAHRSPGQLADDWDSCFAEAVETLWAEAAGRLEKGQDVILDFGFWTRASRDHAREQAGSRGALVRHYYIFAPDDVLKERIAGRGGPIAERNVRNFQELRKLFEEPAEDENAVVIDNYGDE